LPLIPAGAGLAHYQPSTRVPGRPRPAHDQL